jgi:hypothetical protein
MAKLYLIIMVLAVSILAISAVAMGEDSHKAITQDLMKLIENNPEIRIMLEESIAKAKEINPDRQTNPVQNLSEYYDFIGTIDLISDVGRAHSIT